MFVVLFSVFLMKCVDYDTLFYENQYNKTHKVKIPEAIYPMDQCVDRLVLCIPCLYFDLDYQICAKIKSSVIITMVI